MSIVSYQKWNYRSIIVLKDGETEKEFLLVDSRDCLAITPIREKAKPGE